MRQYQGCRVLSNAIETFVGLAQVSSLLHRLYGTPQISRHLAAFQAVRPPDVEERFFDAPAWHPGQLQLAQAQHAAGLLQQHGMLPHPLAALVQAEMARLQGKCTARPAMGLNRVDFRAVLI